MCQFILCDVLNVFFWDHWRSRSRRGSCQVWFLSVTRPERLQNCIIRSHMVATSRLCLSELLCPTFSTCGIVISDHVLYASAVCTCVSFFYDVLNDFFWDPRRSRSHRGSCQILLFRTKRAESLQNFIIRTHMVATGRLCLSKPLCPTFCNFGSSYSMMFRMFFPGPSGVTFPSWVLSIVVFQIHTS